MAEIVVQRAAAGPGLPSAASLRAWAGAALGRRRGAVTIRLVDAAESHALNHRYRGHDRPTNVLSFPAASVAGEPALGDLVICAPVVAREAREQDKPVRAHWAHMVVHGCLHLLGFDHERAAEADRMEAREARILRRLGFADPYE